MCGEGHVDADDRLERMDWLWTNERELDSRKRDFGEKWGIFGCALEGLVVD